MERTALQSLDERKTKVAHSPLLSHFVKKVFFIIGNCVIGFGNELIIYTPPPTLTTHSVVIYCFRLKFPIIDYFQQVFAIRRNELVLVVNQWS